MSNIKPLSRRNFVATTGLLVAAATLKLKGANLSGWADEPIIDIHQHTDYAGRTNDELFAHQKTMGVSTTILLPAGHDINYGSTNYGFSNGLQVHATGNEACYKIATEKPKQYLFGSCEVPDAPNAIKEIEKYLKLGAPIIGEQKFNVEIDSPEMEAIYELAQTYKVPVLMHFQYKIYNRGFEKMTTILKKYPKVNFIGHAQTWWANIDKNYPNPNLLYPVGKVTPGGLTDRMLTEFPNMYGDMSAGSGLRAMTRDEDHMRAFMERHQNQLLYGSDCDDKVGEGKACTGAQAIAAIKKLAPTKEIERKILYYNAKKLMRLDV
jgi:predicted TIM-barrel fold metal-dependent hydrolase